MAQQPGEGTKSPEKKCRKTNTTSSTDDTVACVVHDIQVLQSEIDRVSNRQTVSPTIVWAMSALIKEGGKTADGFVSLANMYARGYNGLDTTRPCAQCHFNDVNHFFTSFWNPSHQRVFIYDSLAMELTWQAKLQIWVLYGRNKNEVHYEFLPVQNQKNGVDCAFFAVAFAYELHVRNGTQVIHPTTATPLETGSHVVSGLPNLMLHQSSVVDLHKELELGYEFHHGTITSVEANEFEARREDLPPKSDHNVTEIITIP